MFGLTGKPFLASIGHMATTRTMFVRFHEINEHEGADWDWWLQVDGNEDELAHLGELLRNGELLAEDDEDAEPWHELHMEDVEPESVVDKLVQYAAEDYYALHNKVVGTFTCPETLAGDRLYKGGIKQFFEAGGAK